MSLKPTTSSPKNKAPMLIILITLALIAVLAAVIIFTPYPTAMLTRILFSSESETPPTNYEELSAKVEVFKDVEYPSEFGGNLLDIYIPINADEPLATIIWTHGGGYVGGDKKGIVYFATSLAAHGYAVVCLNYERAPEARYPSQLIQLGEVCAFVEANTQYHLDSTRLVLAGDSAGAQISAQFASCMASKEYAALVGIEQLVPIENIKGMLLYCGPYNLERFESTRPILDFLMKRIIWAYTNERNWQQGFAQEATTIYHLTADFPPSFITDGNYVSFEADARELEQALLNLGVEVDSFYIDSETERVPHVFQYSMETPAAIEAFAKTLAFLNEHVR